MSKQRLFLTIMTLALLPRILFAYQWSTLPYAQGAPYLDAAAYDQWAKSIAEGHWLRSTAFYQSPLYPYFLALIYKTLGSNPFLISLLQSLMDACTCGLLALIADRRFGRGAAYGTALLAALYRPMIFYSAPLMKETLGLFLLTFFVYYWCEIEEQKSAHSKEAAAGLSLGLAALVRTNVLLLAPVALLLALIQKRAWPWRFLFAMVLAVAPATLHNRWTSGEWILVNSAGGFNFYIGHWSEANGSNLYPDAISTDPAQEEADTLRVASEALGHLPTPAETSRYWTHQALHNILANPWNELALAINKTRLFWNHYESPDNYDIGFISREFNTILGWPLFNFAWISVLAAAGLILAKPKASGVLLALTGTYFFSVILFYITDRYRLPVVIFLLPLAGAGLTLPFQAWRQAQWLKLTLAAMAMGLASGCLGSALLNPHTLDSYNWGLVASLEAKAHHDLEAIQALEQALHHEPINLTAQALIQTSDSYERLGRLSEAKSVLEKATELYPKDGLTYHNLGRFLFEHGDAKSARPQFVKSIEIAPWNYQPYVGLCLTDLSLREFGEAAWAVQQGERMAPEQYDWDRLQKQLSQKSL